MESNPGPKQSNKQIKRTNFLKSRTTKTDPNSDTSPISLPLSSSMLADTLPELQNRQITVKKSTPMASNLKDDNHPQRSKSAFISSDAVSSKIMEKIVPLNVPSLRKIHYEQRHKVKRLEAKRQSYAADSERKKQVRLKKYCDNPDKEKEARKRKYHDNPDKEKEARKRKYNDNPDKEKEARKIKYHTDPKEKQAQKKLYRADPERKKEDVKRRHHNAPDKVRRRSDELRKTKKAVASKFTSCKIPRDKAARVRFAREKHRDISYKRKIDMAKYLLTIPLTDEFDSNKASLHSFADYIVNKLNAVYSASLKQSYHFLYACHRLCTALLHGLDMQSDTKSKFIKLTGDQRHLTTQMPYYCNERLDSCKAIPIDEEGDVISKPSYTEYPILNVNKDSSVLGIGNSETAAVAKTGGYWDCTIPACRWGQNAYTLEVISELESIYGRLIASTTGHIAELVHEMGQCCINDGSSNNGHHLTCHTSISDDTFENISGCSSFFLSLRRLQIHFPKIRTLVRTLYEMKRHHLKAAALKTVLDESPKQMYKQYIMLTKEGNIDRHHSASSVQTTGPSTDSSVLRKMHADSINIFTKHHLDLPIFPCQSCQILKSRSQCVDLSMTKKIPILNSQVYIEVLRGRNFSIGDIKKGECLVCNKCHALLRKNEMPPACYKNRMDVTETNSKLKKLTDWERMLIPRAHAFQSIFVPRTVSGARMPSNQCHRKQKGVTLFLPIPVEETLEHVLKDDEVIRTSQLRIAVRTGLSNKLIIFEDIVDIQHVYDALRSLKFDYKNPLYQNINLPDTVEEFRKIIDDSPFSVCDGDSSTDILISSVDDPNIEVSNNLDSFPLEDCTDPPNSILSQITPEEMKEYDNHNYTLMPIDNQRIPTEASSLYKLNKVDGQPIKPYEMKDLDVRAHPTLFPDAKFGLNDPERSVSISECEYSKCRLRSKSPKFRQNKSYCFHLHHNRVMKELSNGIYNALNTHNYDIEATMDDINNKIERGELDKNIATIFSQVRGTQEYFKIPRMNLETMLRNYGPATWFLTWSPTEWLWPELKDFILKCNPNLSGDMNISQLTSADPVNTAIFINNKFEAFLKFLQGPTNPIGKVKHFFIRREYQNRCMPHFHCMVWIEDAPVIGESPDEEVENFITKYVTCHLPDKGDPLFEVVDSVQRHKCNDYCTKTYSGKKVKGKKYCRFKFPRQPRKDFKLNDVAQSIAARKTPKKLRLYELPRSSDEVSINDYSPVCLMVSRCNIDLQFIAEKTCTVAEYVCKYQTKAETSSLSVQFSKSANSTKSRLWSMGLLGLQSREVGILEAIDTLLGHPLIKTDPKTLIKWVNTNHKKNRRLKKVEERSGNDIFAIDNVDDRYPNRPKDMEHVSLIDFCSNYDPASKSDIEKRNDLIILNKNIGSMKKRNMPALISHYIPNKLDKRDQYYEQFLLLFKPWRERKDVLGSHNKTFEETFNDECSHNEKMKLYEARMSSQYESKKILSEKIKEEEAKIEDDVAPEHMHFSADIHENIAQEFNEGLKEDSSPFSEYIANFNSDQTRVFCKVISRLHKQMPDVNAPRGVPPLHAQCTSDPLHMFISGSGGTGKSYWIKGVSSYIKQVFNAPVALMAPTGIAASNINGMTVHRLLHLPVQHGSVPPYAQLSDETLNQTNNLLKDVKLFILDEISMVSNLMLHYIHRRLCEIFGKQTHLMGGVNIVFLGDLLQLAPVKNGPCFTNLMKNEMQLLRTVGSMNLWSGVEFEEFLTNVRQENDKTFGTLLKDIRVGKLSDADEQWLMEKCGFTYSSTKPEQQLNEICTYVYEQMLQGRVYTLLVPTNKKVIALNEAVLDMIPGKKYNLHAKDVQITRRVATLIESKAVKDKIKELEKDPRQTAGLESCLTIKIGAKVMLRRNIDVSRGLCNGAIGEILKFVVHPSNKNKIAAILVKFDKGTSEIKRVKSEFFIHKFGNKNFKIQREQFPLSLAYAMTVHKAQGLTLKYAIVDCGKDLFDVGQGYVALSRCTSSENLKIIKFNSSKIRPSIPAWTEYIRLGSKSVPETMENYRPKSTRRCTTKDIDYVNKVKTFNIQNVVNGADSHTANSPSVGTFRNPGRICYANATLQCLLDIVPNTAIKSLGELGVIAEKHKKCMRTSLSVLRSQVGHQFELDADPNDPVEFFFRLLDTQPYSSLKSLFEIQVSERYQCSNLECRALVSQSVYPKIVQQVNATRVNRNVQELIDISLQDQPVPERLCKNCHLPITHYQNISSTSDFVVVQITPLTEDLLTKKITLVKQIPTRSIKLGQQTYKFRSMISHCGADLNALRAHYIAFVKKNRRWVSISDETAKIEPQWPQNGWVDDGNISPYLLFYSR